MASPACVAGGGGGGGGLGPERADLQEGNEAAEAAGGRRRLPSSSSSSSSSSAAAAAAAASSSGSSSSSPSRREEEAEASSPAGPSSPAGCVSGSGSGPVPKERFPGQSLYHLKWVRWKEQNTPVVTQNENGPCPLLAIMNALLLAWKVKLPPMMEIITAEQLMEYLGDYILDAKPKEISEIQRLNYEQNMSDAMAILHKLQTGLDVNVRFTGVRVFEYTPECIVFDLLDIPLYHGWLVDPQGQLYLLVTDQGFLTEEKVVWESLHNVDGDGNFCDSEFHLRPPSDPETVYRGQQDQIDQDYLMALSLQQEQQSQDINWEQIPEGLSDLELAKKLQEEEDRRASQFYQEQEQAAAEAAEAEAEAAQLQAPQIAQEAPPQRERGSLNLGSLPAGPGRFLRCSSHRQEKTTAAPSRSPTLLDGKAWFPFVCVCARV
ncbi:ubiquitin carboxyl-terminal hydrolase MINDY-2 isoform X3 [Paroedura picta]|uniref:ubiquitin carboxyl-terminal hydrolase MINDY-2 isoform X3 n=1 Tax=Paroedura picta TaxID=143630 RepID=UPI00405688C3